jgi:hypothetical protein
VATARGERYEIKSLADVENMRQNPPARPANLLPDDEAAWSSYLDYYRKRLDEVEIQLRQNPAANVADQGPRSWQSYREFRAPFERGTGYQAEFAQDLRTQRPHLEIDENVGIAKHGGGTTKFADQLAYDPATRRIEAFSNKSHDFSAVQNLDDVVPTVNADVREALEKYGGMIEIRRPTHPLFGQKARVNTVTLVYDSRLVPAALRGGITTAAVTQGAKVYKTIKIVVVFWP